MKLKRLSALALACALILSLLAGCGGNSSSGNSGGPSDGDAVEETNAGGVELTVVTSYGGDDGNRKNYEAAVASYEADSGNTVLDASSTSNEEWKAKVLTDFETGTEPDVLFFFCVEPKKPSIFEGKSILPLVLCIDIISTCQIF